MKGVVVATAAVLVWREVGGGCNAGVAAHDHSGAQLFSLCLSKYKMLAPTHKSLQNSISTEIQTKTGHKYLAVCKITLTSSHLADTEQKTSQSE